MTRHTFAIVCALLMTLVITDAAQAMYHPTLGRFAQRDPNGTALSPEHRVGAGPAANGGFAQRDPVRQYADGMNLYQYLRSNPPISADPQGTISFNFNAFIGGWRGNWLPEPVQIPGALAGTFHEFATDRRGFGQFNGTNARLFSDGEVSPERIGWLLPRPGPTAIAGWDVRHEAGITTRRTTVLKWGQQSTTSRRAVLESSSEGAANLGPCVSTITVSASGRHAFSPPVVSPTIDYEVTFTFTKHPQLRIIEVELEGWHNRFPDYEAYVDGQLFYAWASPHSGPGFVTLNRTTNAEASTIVFY